MFKSIKYIKYIGYNETTIHSYEIEITDSSVVICKGAGAVISEYSKRNLNVAANLLKLFLYYEKQYGITIQQQIKWCKEYQPLFTKELKKELEKYLILV